MSVERLLVRRPLQLLVGGCLLLLAAGCGGKGTVTGKVTFEGKALPGGYVSFTPEGGGKGGSSSIDPKDGTYTVANLPTGTYKVSVNPLTVSNPMQQTGGKGGMPPGMMRPGMGPPPGTKTVPKGAAKEANISGAIPYGPSGAGKAVKIPDKYLNSDTSGLTLTVKRGSQDFPIDLK
jgi:hypothetical protein